MFDREIENIISTVRQRTIMNSPAIAIKDILAADVPFVLKTFFRANIEFMLIEELQQQHKGSRFNFEHPEVQSLQNQINSILVLNFSYPRSEYNERVDDAVHLMVNYLIRPQWTLKHFLFQKEEEISASLIVRLLRYFSPYDYLRELIIHYIQEKHITSFRQEDFALFLWKADGEFIRRKNGGDFAKLLAPMFEFLDYPDNSGNKSLSVKALMKFFEDKGVTTIIHSLEGMSVQGTEELTLKSLSELLADTQRTMGVFEVDKPSAEPVSSPDPAQEPRTPQIVPTETETPEPKPLAVPPVPWEMTEGDRKRFVRKIFKQDERAFISALYAISDLATWKQASAYIDNIFIENDVDPYCNEAKKFLEIAYQRYYPRK